jgi:AAA+ ATPase superfamily predicted ATPase
MTDQNSAFIEEGRNLLITELGKNYGLYFSILAAISSGATSQGRIEDLVGTASISGHIKRLIEDYNIITRRRPILAKEGTHAVRFEIEDNFLHFWFLFFERHRALIELGNMDALREMISRSYPTYSGLMLERYFKKKLAESGGFIDIGSWWEPKGNENQIDIVGLKLEKNQALAVEVKRKQENFRISKLEEKVGRLKTKVMSKYDFELKCLTLEDL